MVRGLGLVFVLLDGFLAAGLVGSKARAGLEDNVRAGLEDEAWAGFKSRHGKKYRSWEEETFRRQIWEEERQFIAEHNQRAEVRNKRLRPLGH